MRVSDRDRNIVHDLARRVAEIAVMPVMAERREAWRRHNRLERVRPMILIFPEGSWGELITPDQMQCEDETLRKFEWNLRSRIYTHEHFRDDTVIEGDFIVRKHVGDTGWGLWAHHRPTTEARGAWAYDPVVHSPADLKKLHFPDVTYDEGETQRQLALAQDLFGDILDVKLKGVGHVSFHLMNKYCGLRGLKEVMMDMATQPGFLHEAMAIFEEGHRRRVQQYVDMNLLSLNNDGTYHSTGGVGYTTELPRQDCAPERIRPCDMWASAEAQELALVSPAMHAEFSLQYEKRLLEPFGLNGYGCCEDLTHKLDDVFTIPNIRRISISPFADVEKCAEKLGGDYIYSWKPHPAHLCGEFSPERIRAYIRHALDVTKGCAVEMILKDTHTCDHQPSRFTRWTEIARELVAEYA